MSASKRTWVQAELRRLPGAEAWLLVRHRSGCFKLPADATVEELLRGVEHGWTMRPPSVSYSPGTVRVPLERWLELELGVRLVEGPAEATTDAMPAEFAGKLPPPKRSRKRNS